MINETFVILFLFAGVAAVMRYHPQQKAMGVLYSIIFLNCTFSTIAWLVPDWMESLIYDNRSVIDRGEWYRLLSSGFLHADLEHLFGNMLGLYIFGRHLVMKGRCNTLQFLSIFIGGVVFGCYYSHLAHLELPRYKGLGASSGVYAVMTSAILSTLLHNIKSFLLPHRIFMLLYLFREIKKIYNDMLGNKAPLVVVPMDHHGHFGGAIFGIVLTLMWFVVRRWGCTTKKPTTSEDPEGVNNGFEKPHT